MLKKKKKPAQHLSIVQRECRFQRDRQIENESNWNHWRSLYVINYWFVCKIPFFREICKK